MWFLQTVTELAAELAKLKGFFATGRANTLKEERPGVNFLIT